MNFWTASLVAQHIYDGWQVLANLLPVALLFLMGQLGVCCFNLRLPPRRQFGRHDQGTVITALTLVMYVLSPVRAPLVLDCG